MIKSKAENTKPKKKWKPHILEPIRGIWPITLTTMNVIYGRDKMFSFKTAVLINCFTAFECEKRLFLLLKDIAVTIP